MRALSRPLKASALIYKGAPPACTRGEGRGKAATLTQGVPLILADGLGDVVGKVLGDGG